MRNSMTFFQDEVPFQRVAAMELVRSLCLKQNPEEPGMVSFLRDERKNMWVTYRSNTSSASRLAETVFVEFFLGLEDPISKPDCGLSSEIEPIMPFQASLIQSDDVRFVPPEDSWRPMRVKLIKVKQFPVSIEP